MSKKVLGGLVAVEILAFSLLEGSMVTLGIIVAPQLFKTIGSRDLAGETFGNILGVWLWFGLGATLALVATGLVSLALSRRKGPFRLLVARLVVLPIMIGLVGAFGFVLDKMDQLQATMTQPIETYPLNTGPRLEYDQLHKLSGNLLSAALVLGLVWFGLSLVALFKLAQPASATTTQPQEEKRPLAGVEA